MYAAVTSLQRIAIQAGNIRFPRPDAFVVSLICVVTAATFLPCHGSGARIFHTLGYIAISALFFLQGARLSRGNIIDGVIHWRLHLITASITFGLYPLLGLIMIMALPSTLPASLWMGVMFLCVLPSTVQSSIALTSIAKGNVAGAVCSATMSNIAGMVITPLMFGVISSLHGGHNNLNGMWEIALRLLVPFVIGHLLRPWIGAWAARNRAILAVTDRGSILLVVYTAFSAAVLHDIWHQVPLRMMGVLGLFVALLLAGGLLAAAFASQAFNLSTADEAAVVFCGSQKSLISAVPIANVLFAGEAAGSMLLPTMMYYLSQLLVCAWLAQRYASFALRSREREACVPYDPN